MERRGTARLAADETGGDGSPVDRRSYLRFAGAAVVAASGAAGVGTAARRVDIADAGADPSGSERINETLRRVHGDGVEVHFPPGTYRLDPLSLNGSDWSLVGHDATLVVPSVDDRDSLSLGGSNWSVEGFTVDLPASGTAPATHLRGDGWTFRDVSFDATDRSDRDATDPDTMTSDDLPRTLSIEGTDSPATYEFTVGGELDRVSPTTPPDAWDGISGSTAAGKLASASCTDTFRFSGSVTDFKLLEGDAVVYLDGERTDPSSLAAATSLPKTITVTGTGAAAEYELSVDGQLEADPERGDPNQWGNVSGTAASGWVETASHVDSYRFSGDLTEFRVREGSLSVAVDGDRLDASGT